MTDKSMNWHEYVKIKGEVPPWPYEIKYGEETELETDVLVLGGGVAGCRAAIAAKKQGAEVILVDRGFAKRSGMGGAGVDHWHGAVTNPCSKVTPEMYSDVAMECASGYTNGLARYIVGKEGWDCLLELEQLGVQIRDEDDDYKGTMFRDEETKLLFAYDVDNKHCLRIYGNTIKPCLDRELKRLGVKIIERTCLTSLLTETGRQGGRVIGATAINDRTGEFYIFKSKATVVCTGRCGGRLWGFAPEVTESQTMSDLNQIAMGNICGWRAGAEMVMYDQSSPGGLLGWGYAPYSMGNSDNTYQGAPITDAEGKRIPHANALGEPITQERQIFEAPHPEDHFVIGHGIGLLKSAPIAQEYNITSLDPELGDKIRSGEYKLPLYTDLTLLDPQHRHLLWNLMLGHEGKCRVPIFENMQQYGFDPATDVLQCAIIDPDAYYRMATWCGATYNPPNWRTGAGGYYVDWHMQTSLPGLFTGGEGPNFGHGCHGESHTTGRYAGRQAAQFALEHGSVQLCREQIDCEKKRVYAPIHRQGDIGWKEFNYAVVRVMQDYCGNYKTEDILKLGIKRLFDLRDTEGERTYACNPHELVRLIESFALVDLGHLYMEAARARKASSKIIGFYRVDYPEIDPKEWNCFLPVCQIDGEIHVRKLPHDYYLREPFCGELKDNYEKYMVPVKEEE